jgi:hypothetical protein
MEITIRLLAGYRRFLPYRPDGAPAPQPGQPAAARDSYSQRVAPGATVDTVLSTLPIPPGEAFTFLVNGRHAERHQTLQGGDLLTVFPAAGGG